MSTYEPGRRRSLDIRRTKLPARPQVATVTSEDSSASPSVAPEVPIFEYRKPKRPRWGFARVARVLSVLILIAGIGLGGYLGFHGLNAARKIIAKAGAGAPALRGVIDPTKLKGEGDGRVNILLLGIGGQGHEGPNLSDTIMVWSLDPKTKDVAALSIPRDLYVKIPGHGYGKINAANVYGGPTLAARTVANVIGVPIHYYAVVDFSGFKQAVDSVGGVDVSVEKPIYDPMYPCDDGTRYAGLYCPFKIAAGEEHMNGSLALKYARSRKTTSDFDRAARQQKVMVALRQKAMQLSTLTNPLKLSGLVDAIGDHFKTSLQPAEIQKLASVAKDIDTAKVQTKVLDTGGADSLLIDGSGKIAGAGSIELPRAGTFDYSDIQDFVKNIFADHYVEDENARIEVENGSGLSGVASTVVRSLKAAHYNVGDPQNADGKYSQTVIYDYTGGKKPYTINYLQRRFGVKAQTASPPSPQVDANGQKQSVPEIRIILGSNYKPGPTPL
jgi:LCP family protein required for cell wall assembly